MGIKYKVGDKVTYNDGQNTGYIMELLADGMAIIQEDGTSCSIVSEHVSKLKPAE